MKQQSKLDTEVADMAITELDFWSQRVKPIAFDIVDKINLGLEYLSNTDIIPKNLQEDQCIII